MQRYDEDEIEHIYLDEEDVTLQPEADSQGRQLAVETPEAYKKLRHVLTGVLLVALLLTFVRGLALDRFLADFMAVFFITFAAFKFMDIEGFVQAYRSFDVVASRIRPWAYAFPFIEAFLGFWYLLSEAPQNLNVLATVITGLALLGAWQEVKRRSRFNFAATKSFIRLPLARVSLIENAPMFLLALVSFIIKL